MKPNFLFLLSFLLLSFSACKKKDSGSKPISFDQMGDTRLNDITGFAMNGDVLGTVANQNGWDNLRYRAASKQWERIGANAGQPNGVRLIVLAEDAEGTYYSRSNLETESMSYAQGARHGRHWIIKTAMPWLRPLLQR